MKVARTALALGALLAVAGAVFLGKSFEFGKANGTPAEIQYLCAQRASGLLEYSASPTCDKNEVLINLADGPIDACRLLPDERVRVVAEPSECSPTQPYLMIPDEDETLFFCYEKTNKLLRYVTDLSQCIAGKESAAFVGELNHPPVAGDDNFTVNEDGGPLLGNVLANDSDADGDPLTVNTTPVSGPAHASAFALNADGSFSYTPEANFNGTDTFEYEVSDPSGASDTGLVTITVYPVNDAPVASGGSGTTDEGSSLNIDLGPLVSDLETSDADLNYVIVTPPAHGLLVGSGPTFVYTTTDPDYFGPDSFTFRVVDRGDPDNCAGGPPVCAAPLSSSTETFSITVDAVNDPPTFDLPAQPDQTVLEDAGAQSVPNFATNIEPGPTNEAGQTVSFLVSNDNPALFTSQPAISPAGTLTFTPAPDANGSANVTVVLRDNGGTANGGDDTSDAQPFVINVTAVNDEPSFALPASPDQSVAQDSGAQTVPGFATNISAGPANESAQVLTFHVSNDNHALFSVQPNIDEGTGNLTYTPAAGATGSAIVSVYLTDDGGTGNGGDDTSPTQTFTITVAPPNAAPVAASQNLSTDEDVVLPITLSATDADDDNLTFIVVVGPAHGALSNFGVVDCTTVVNTCTQTVDYTPAAEFNGSDSFTFKANDGQVDSNIATVAITVNAVNDPPSFTPGGNVTVLEDSGGYSATWATAISPGPADEAAQTVSFNITGNTNAALFSVAPAIAPDGTLTFTPAPNASGTATITVTLQDSGGGTDTSAPGNFDITVTGANDAPSFTAGGNVTVDEDSGAYSAAWATGISAGPANESGQTLTFNITGNTNPSLFSAGPAIAANGTLTFTPAANQNGSAMITVTLSDNGGTANGGVDTSAPQPFTVTVTAVNDPPVAQNKNYSAQANMRIDGLTGLLVGVTDADAGIDGCAPTFSVAGVSATTPAGGTVTLTNAATGTFDFDPPPGATGNVTFTYTVSDTGCPGTATSAPASVTVAVAGPVIWFVDDAALVNGNGTLASPFNALPFADSVDAANHRIFLFSGTYADGIALNSGEWLIGQGVTHASNTFDGLMGISPPAGTIARPPIATGTAVVQGTVGVATNSVVRGLAIQSSALTGVGDVGGPVSGVDLSQTSVTTTTGTGVLLSDVGGTFAFTSLTTAGGTGANLTGANSGATFSFANVTVSSGANAGLVSTGGGTLIVTGAGNTIVSTTGTALNVTNTTIGASGLTFQSISANGAVNGIVLNNTGANAGLTVTGSGGTCTEGNTSGCTGGTIQNTTGADDSSTAPVGTGVVLNSTRSVSLTRMHIHDHSNYGIRGTSVNGFTLANSVVNGVNGTNVATPFNDGSISFDNLSGAAAIANSAVAGGYQRNIRVDNTTGTLTLTIASDSIHNTGNAAGDDGILIEIGGGTATLNVTNNTFAAHGGDHLNVSLLGSPTVSLTFTGNAWSGGHPIGLGQGLFILAAAFNSPGTFSYNISNNGTALVPLVGNNSGGAIHVNKGSGTGSFSGTISGNFIGDAAVNGSGSSNASGIDVEAHGSSGSHTVVISNNTVRQFHNDGILVLVGEGNAVMNATVTGNTVTNPDASIASLHGMHFNIGTLPTDAGQSCLDVKNNVLTVAGSEGNGGVDLRMRQRQLTTVQLPGYAGANNDNAAVQTFLTGPNLNAVTTILASNTVASGGGGFIGGAACPQP